MEKQSHNKSKEQIAMEMKEKQQMQSAMEHQTKIQKLFLETYLPIVQLQTPLLLKAGKMSNQLSQIMQAQLQTFLATVKVSQLEIPKLLNDTLEKNPQANKKDLDPLIAIVEACGDMTVTELSEVMQSFQQSANLQAEKLVGGVNLDECYVNLKKEVSYE